jgi:WhiB family redox-sensing transcriptional regulator
LKLHPQAIRSSKEVKDMTITVLDRRDGSADALMPASLGELHDRADTVPDELLPCRVNDSDLWFAESPADVEYAKALCQDCPVRDLCLSGALERHEPWGVWGGELFLQGVVIPRKRPRGRPRKNEQAA